MVGSPKRLDSELRIRLTSAQFSAGFPNPSFLWIHTFARTGFPAGAILLISRSAHKGAQGGEGFGADGVQARTMKPSA